MHNLSSVVFCLSIHNNPYICFSKNLLTFNALTLYYFYMKKISTILWMVAIWMMGLMPVRAAAGVPGRDLQSEKGETVICRGVEAHTSGPMLQVGQVAPDFHAVNANKLIRVQGKESNTEHLPQSGYSDMCLVRKAIQCPGRRAGEYSRVMYFHGPSLRTVTFLFYRRAG